MPKLQWYKRDVVAAKEGMRGMTLEERGAYNAVLDLLYERAGDLAAEADDRLIAGEMDVDVRVWRRLKARLIALGKLYIADGRLRNRRADAEIADGLRRLAQKVEAGKARHGQRPGSGSGSTGSYHDSKPKSKPDKSGEDLRHSNGLGAADAADPLKTATLTSSSSLRSEEEDSPPAAAESVTRREPVADAPGAAAAALGDFIRVRTRVSDETVAEVAQRFCDVGDPKPPGYVRRMVDLLVEQWGSAVTVENALIAVLELRGTKDPIKRAAAKLRGWKADEEPRPAEAVPRKSPHDQAYEDFMSGLTAGSA